MNYLDNSAPKGTHCLYKVVATAGAGGTGAQSADSNIVDLLTTPAAPLTCQANGTITDGATSGPMDIQWPPSSSPVVELYRVLEGTTTGGPYTEVATVPAGDSLHVVLSRPLGTYFYVVVAHNASGDSTYSQESSSSIINGGFSGGSVPALTAVMGPNGHPVLTWTGVEDATGYKLRICDPGLNQDWDETLNDGEGGIVYTQIPYSVGAESAVGEFDATDRTYYDSATSRWTDDGTDRKVWYRICAVREGFEDEYCAPVELDIAPLQYGLDAPVITVQRLDPALNGGRHFLISWPVVDGATYYTGQRFTSGGSMPLTSQGTGAATNQNVIDGADNDLESAGGGAWVVSQTPDGMCHVYTASGSSMTSGTGIGDEFWVFAWNGNLKSHSSNRIDGWALPPLT